MSGTPELVALVENREMGRVQRDRNGRLSFTYDDRWRTAEDSFPLSLSMPLALAEHGHSKIDAYLWGLLPDNEQVLAKWGRKFHVSARNAFGLIANVGEDSPGAVQFVQPERVEALRRATPADVNWLTEAMIAERLRALRADHGAWRLPRDTGQFSLAGAQPKTALFFLNRRWGLPSGRVPTTHILKPPTGEFDGHVENEHFCLELARALGFAVPNSRIERFEDEIAIVVERYDRVQVARAAFQRIHQEDICQALAISPTQKYESDGGPGVGRTIEMLRTYSTKPEEDVRTFVDAVAFNWLIAGTDAHAKNYAVLIGESIRLAPLYDLASVLPYADSDLRKVRLAMKIGGQYRLDEIGLRQWQKMAKEVRVDAEGLLQRVGVLADQIAERVPEVADRLAREGLRHSILGRLKRGLAERAGRCKKLLRL
ncbi:MAG TPA: type II toxin-antitoxin system HipA family toxin [Candidatus Acidoferrum sp.]|jgi:serine/threonine-protein kinase HipA|nr:type II toxin-antitoxin system HipA family toxin [Candidatus Acidoferrum sp.]